MYSRLNVQTLDHKVEIYNKYASRLETLYNSQKFFANKCVKETILLPLEAEIEVCEAYLKRYEKPQTLGELYRGEQSNLIVALKLLINDLRLFFQVDTMISNEGIENLCPMIIFEWPSLTIEEIAICFAQFKKGYFGGDKLYNRLDAAIILKVIKQFYSEKLERIKERNYVLEAHAKIDINERTITSSSQLLNEALANYEIHKVKR